MNKDLDDIKQRIIDEINDDWTTVNYIKDALMRYHYGEVFGIGFSDLGILFCKCDSPKLTLFVSKDDRPDEFSDLIEFLSSLIEVYAL